MVVITKSVVSTSIELDVKYRVASGRFCVLRKMDTPLCPATFTKGNNLGVITDFLFVYLDNEALPKCGLI